MYTKRKKEKDQFKRWEQGHKRCRKSAICIVSLSCQDGWQSDDAITACHLSLALSAAAKCWEMSMSIGSARVSFCPTFICNFTVFSTSFLFKVSFSFLLRQIIGAYALMNADRLKAWHSALPHYHAFIFMVSNCKGVVDSVGMCF